MGFSVAGLIMGNFPFKESLAVGTLLALVMLVVNLFVLRRAKQAMWGRGCQ